MKLEVDDSYSGFKAVTAAFGPAEQVFFWVQGGGAVRLHAFVDGSRHVVTTNVTTSPPSSGTILTDYPQAIAAPVTSVSA